MIGQKNVLFWTMYQVPITEDIQEIDQAMHVSHAIVSTCKVWYLEQVFKTAFSVKYYKVKYHIEAGIKTYHFPPSLLAPYF